MKSVSLKAFPRALTRRGGAKRLREHGRIPAVIYSRKNQPQNLEVNAKEFGDLVHHSASENMLVDLELSGDGPSKRLALVQEIQHHPLNGNFLHIDFHEVAADEKVTINVPVETVGEAEGVKTGGGVLEHVLFKLRARGLPKDLPEVITVDVTSLKLNEAIHLGEIKALPGVELLGDKQIPVISISAPRTEEEEAAATEAAAAPGEVEMIKEKKEEGAEGAAAGGKAGEKAPAKAAGAEKAPAAGDKKAAPAAEKEKKK